MTINVTPEQERIIQAEIENGHFRSPDEVLDHREIRRTQAQMKAQPLSVNDALLAATALQHDLAIVLRNVSDFSAVGLAVVNPWEA